MRSRRVCLCCAIAALFLSATSIAAQTPCSGVAGGTSYKVLIDEVQFANPGGSAPAVGLELIHNSVEGALEKLRLRILKPGTQGSEILYLTCTGRHPGQQQFKPTVNLAMVANHAILEFWGTLSPLGADQYQFDIQYVMFPVESQTPPKPSVFAATSKKMANKPTPQEVRNYLIDARAHLPAYFSLAAGVQAYSDNNLDNAVRYLCEARTRLKRKTGQEELVTFADQLAAKAGEELRKNSNSAVSMMTAAETNDYCGFATRR